MSYPLELTDGYVEVFTELADERSLEALLNDADLTPALLAQLAARMREVSFTMNELRLDTAISSWMPALSVDNSAHDVSVNARMDGGEPQLFFRLTGILIGGHSVAFSCYLDGDQGESAWARDSERNCRSTSDVPASMPELAAIYEAWHQAFGAALIGMMIAEGARNLINNAAGLLASLNETWLWTADYVAAYSPE